MYQLPAPPVPQKLKAMLKDYPEHIKTLESNLLEVVTKPLKATPPFEVAIWTLEDTLERFVSEAREELANAERKGNSEEIENAKQKELLMLHSTSVMRKDLRELFHYFEQHKDVFS